MPLGRLSQRVILPVPHQSDYLNQWAIHAIRSEPLADHAFARPEASRKTCVDPLRSRSVNSLPASTVAPMVFFDRVGAGYFETIRLVDHGNAAAQRRLSGRRIRVARRR